MPRILSGKHIILFVALAIPLLAFVRTTAQIVGSDRRLERLREEVAALEKVREGLQGELAHKESTEYVEQQARDNLNFVRPGEEIFVLSDDVWRDYLMAPEQAADTGILGTSTEERSFKDSNIYLWYRLFF